MVRFRYHVGTVDDMRRKRWCAAPATPQVLPAAQRRQLPAEHPAMRGARYREARGLAAGIAAGVGYGRGSANGGGAACVEGRQSSLKSVKGGWRERWKRLLQRQQPRVQRDMLRRRLCLAGAACEAGEALVSSETSIFTVAGSRAVPAVCAAESRGRQAAPRQVRHRNRRCGPQAWRHTPSWFWHSALSSGEKVRSLGRGNVEGEAVRSSTPRQLA